MHLYALALGSNRRSRHGTPAQTLIAARAALGRAGVRVLAASPTLRSVAVGPAGRTFANAALLVETPLAPPALLALVKGIERAFGRRPGRRWGPRTLDIDLALWSGGRWPRYGTDRRLTIPHPALGGRAFVLVPLDAVVPGWRIPRLGRRVRQQAWTLTARAPLA